MSNLVETRLARLNLREGDEKEYYMQLFSILPGFFGFLAALVYMAKEGLSRCKANTDTKQTNRAKMIVRELSKQQGEMMPMGAMESGWPGQHEGRAIMAQ